MNKTSWIFTHLSETKFKPLPKQELNDIIREYQKTHSKKLQDIIVNTNLRYIVELAKRFSAYENMSDLINSGVLGLISAIDKFDVDSGNSFITYAKFWINYELERASNNSIIETPVHYVRALAAINRIEKKFENENKDYTIDDVIEEYSELVTKQHYVVLDVKLYHKLKQVRNLTTTVDNDNSDEDRVIPNEILSISSDDLTDKKINNDEYQSELIERMSNILTTQECKIMMLKYGIGVDFPYSTEKIAQEVGLTGTRVLQIFNKAKSKLQENKELFYM